jgi:hypothetical protein
VAYIFAAAAAAAAADDGFSPVSFGPGFVEVVVLLVEDGGIRGTPDTGDRLRPPRRLVVVGRKGGGDPLVAFILIPPTILLPLLRLFGDTERVEPGRASELISTGMIVCWNRVTSNLFSVDAIYLGEICVAIAAVGQPRVNVCRQRAVIVKAKSRIVL